MAKRVSFDPRALQTVSAKADACQSKRRPPASTPNVALTCMPRLGPRLSEEVLTESMKSPASDTCQSMQSMASFEALKTLTPATPGKGQPTNEPAESSSKEDSESGSSDSDDSELKGDFDGDDSTTRASDTGTVAFGRQKSKEPTEGPIALEGSCSIHWRQGELLGSGSFGKVYAGQDASTGQIFAVKVARIRPRDGMDQTFCAKLQDELKICRDLRHPNIVSCLGHAYDRGRLEIFLEYVAGGSLRRMLEQFGAVTAPLLCNATRDILKGLQYLHSHRPPVVHRDLKGANVLVALDFCMKLADFGCAKRDNGTKSFTTMGTLHWMAPEVLESARGHGRKADIWSLGCVVLEMVTASDPWGKDAFRNIMHAMHVIRTAGSLPAVPHDLQRNGDEEEDPAACAQKTNTCDFVFECCLQREPELRPCASELLQHVLLQEVKEESADAAPSLANSTTRSVGTSTSSLLHSSLGGNQAAAARTCDGTWYVLIGVLVMAIISAVGWMSAT